MNDPIEITYVNHSTNPNRTKVFLFMKNQVPSFDALRDGVAWRVLEGGGSAFFLFPAENAVSASWNSRSGCTPPVQAQPGRQYAVQQNGSGIAVAGGIAAADGGPQCIQVVNHADAGKVVSVDLYKSDRLLMTSGPVPCGQEADFALSSKLYWGLADHIQEGQQIGSALLCSEEFFELDLEGISQVTVGLYGSPQDGYHFQADSLR